MGIGNPDLMVPFAEWQEVDVVFPASANVDVPVLHTLAPSDPEAIYYIVLRKSAAGHAYHDTSVTRKAWQPGYILLRSDVANVKMTLLLFTSHTARTLPF